MNGESICREAVARLQESLIGKKPAKAKCDLVGRGHLWVANSAAPALRSRLAKHWLTAIIFS